MCVKDTEPTYINIHVKTVKLMWWQHVMKYVSLSLYTFSLYLVVNDVKYCLKSNSGYQNPCWDYPIGVKGLLLTVPESTLPSSRTKGCKTLLVCVPQIFDDPSQKPPTYTSTTHTPAHTYNLSMWQTTGADPMLPHLHFKHRMEREHLRCFSPQWLINISDPHFSNNVCYQTY